MRRGLGPAAFFAGLLDEVVTVAEHFELIRNGLPSGAHVIFNQKVAVSLMVAGLITWWTHRNRPKDDEDTPTPSSRTQQQKTEVHDSGNARIGNVRTGDVHVPITINPYPPATSPAPAPAAQPTVEKPKPTLRYVENSARVAYVGFEVWERGFYEPRFKYFYEKHEKTPQQAAIATFRNVVLGASGANAGHVRAHILYRDKTGAELGYGVAAAPWTTEEWDATSIAPGEVRHLILGMFGDAFTVFNNIKNNYNQEPADPLETQHIFAAEFIAEVQLLNFTSDKLLEEHFEVTAKPPSVKRLSQT